MRECEVAEVCEHLGFRMTPQIRTCSRGINLAARAHQHNTCAFERIALFPLVKHQRDASIGQDVFGVQRQVRQQKERSTVERGRDIHQRAIWVARARHQSRKSSGTRFAQQFLGGQTGIEGAIGLH
jgi:hypothetical protein